MKNKNFDFIFIFLISLYFCYFASIKKIYIAIFILLIVALAFEKIKNNELFLLRAILPFYIIPLVFYNKAFGIFALIFSVFLFSAIYIFWSIKKFNQKKIIRWFFIIITFIYVFLALWLV